MGVGGMTLLEEFILLTNFRKPCVPLGRVYLPCRFTRRKVFLCSRKGVNTRGCRSPLSDRGERVESGTHASMGKISTDICYNLEVLYNSPQLSQGSQAFLIHESASLGNFFIMSLDQTKKPNSSFTKRLGSNNS